MEHLLGAIYNYLKEGDFATLITVDTVVQMYNTEAPEETVCPYAVYQIVTSIPEWTFTENSENCLIQFNLCSDGDTCEEVCDMEAALRNALEFHDLTITGAETISLVRVASLLSHNDGIWQINMTFRIVFELGE